MIVTITSNPAVDWTTTVNSFEFAEINRVSARTREASGKGINVSVALKRNDVPTVAIFPAGGEAGRFITKELEVQGIAIAPVKSPNEVRTNITLVVPGHGGTKINELGGELNEDVQQGLLRTASEQLGELGAAREKNPLIFAICGSLPPGTPMSFQRDLVRLGREGSAYTVVDASDEALSAAIGEGPDLIKPNVHELAAETGRDIHTLGDVIVAAKLLRDRGVGALLVSLGADGIVLVDGAGAVFGKAVRVPVLNTVGAGDASLAGFLAGLDAGMNREDCLRSSLLYASSAVGHPTTLFTVDQSLNSQLNVTTIIDSDLELSEPALGTISSERSEKLKVSVQN